VKILPLAPDDPQPDLEERLAALQALVEPPRRSFRYEFRGS
jgi:hypothetical protein